MFTHRLPRAITPRRHRTRAAIAITAASIACGLAQSPASAAYTFTKIVDSATARPGSASLFTAFDSVAFDGQNAAFIGTAGGQKGVYQWNGSALSTIAQQGSLMPSSATTFGDFRNLSLDAGRVAFQGGNGTFHGVYTNLGGSLRRVADTTMTMPGSTAIFKELLGLGAPSFDVAINGSNVFFSGFGSSGNVFDEGVYREAAGALTAIANRSMIPPGSSEPFIFFRGEVDADEGHVSFIGRAGNNSALWTTHGVPAGQLRKIFDRTTPMPDFTLPGGIWAPNSFSIDQGQIAFYNREDASLDSFLYLQSDGVFRKIVEQKNTNPVTGTRFSVVDHDYSLSSGTVLFSGWSLFNGDSIDAIYRSKSSGGFDTVISDLDALDAKNLTDVDIFKDSLAGDDFVFRAIFSDGSTGIYLAAAGPELPTQTIAIEPTFDVQLRPGNQYPIGDGQTTLVIDGGSGTSFPVQDVLAEFPLGNIPAGAQITAAQIKLDATSSATMTVNALAYAGDGLASLSDEFVNMTSIGFQAGTISTAGDVTISLNPTFINDLLGQHSHLGLRLVSATTGPFFNIAASESTTGFAPTLTITYTTSQAGDFDGDSDVDGADFVLWQRGLGTLYDADDLAAWRANFGAGAPTTPVTQVPEPTPATLLALPALFLLTPRRKTRPRSPLAA